MKNMFGSARHVLAALLMLATRVILVIIPKALKP